MKHQICLIIFLFLSLNNFAQKNVHIIINTTFGDIEVELYASKAPKTVENFLRYVSNDLYVNSSFFRVCTPENEADRVIKIEVIQGGNIPENLLFPPIELETTQKTRIKHENGTISMARGEPNTAQSSFFICINNQPELDYGGKRNPDGMGFAAFGKVTKGMNVVLKIQNSENENQLILSPIVINSIKLIQQ